MKKLIRYSIATILAVIFCFNLYAQSGTSIAPRKTPGPVDLDKHSEIMAKIKNDLKDGQIAFYPKGTGIDTSLDLSKHPELVRAIIRNPANWPVILKAYNRNNDTLAIEGKNKQVIRNIFAYLIEKNFIKARGDVSSFMLTNDSFSLNGKKLPEKFHVELKEKYIKTPAYVVYYGNSEMKGEGIFQRSDNL